MGHTPVFPIRDYEGCAADAMLSRQIFGIKESPHNSIYALICRQSGVVTTLSAIGGDGLYKAYCPLLTYRVSGSKCAAITTNARQITIVG